MKCKYCCSYALKNLILFSVFINIYNSTQHIGNAIVPPWPWTLIYIGLQSSTFVLRLKIYQTKLCTKSKISKILSTQSHIYKKFYPPGPVGQSKFCGLGLTLWKTEVTTNTLHFWKTKTSCLYSEETSSYPTPSHTCTHTHKIW